MYQSKRILCPMSDAMLTDEQIMDRYGQYFGIDPWVSFSGCPVVNLTRVSEETSISTSLTVNQCIKIGVGCYIESTVLPAFPSGPTKLTCVAIKDGNYGQITIGNNTVLQGTTICSYQSVSIGERVMFGPNVVIMDCSGHAIERRGEQDESERLKVAPVQIGNDVWIGYGVIVLPGVSIGEGAVIGAGSVVCNDIPDGCVAAGNPCTVKYEIKKRGRR
ncbi:DapH/DapD/GlmU-related protein [Vibrio splendidus]|uniref:DapH/DapD/GlmU-related protein n=1 Tax=Vibrio splendidus TaxID=29497 RepID=UPI000C852EA4|nr:DapH/DapD/GlmU-related protein [Vibrio splendidus]PMI72645.1 maltose acetyltransferase [Vibrio splendidus]PMK54634.1 maltose acetyltransferase [Vibrio splendidus]